MAQEPGQPNKILFEGKEFDVILDKYIAIQGDDNLAKRMARGFGAEIKHDKIRETGEAFSVVILPKK